VRVINDAYNANPDSMRAALTALASMAGQARSFAVLGQMVSFGESNQRREVKQVSAPRRDVAERIEQREIDRRRFTGLLQQVHDRCGAALRPGRQCHELQDLASRSGNRLRYIRLPQKAAHRRDRRIAEKLRPCIERHKHSAERQSARVSPRIYVHENGITARNVCSS